MVPNSSSHIWQCWGSEIQSLAPNSPHGCPGIIHPHPQLAVPSVPFLLALVTSLPDPVSAVLVPALSSSVLGLPTGAGPSTPTPPTASPFLAASPASGLSPGGHALEGSIP